MPVYGTSSKLRNSTRRLNGLELEILEGGGGPPLLMLHDIEYLNVAWPYLERLAERFSLIVPSHPGFGASELPDEIDCVDDLAYFYLDLLRELGGPVSLAGSGFGGWLAAEVAVRCTHHIQRLLLVNPVGIKVSDPTTRDVADNFMMSAGDFLRASWADPARAAELMKLPDPTIPEGELVTLLRNRQSAALFTWKPFMHNPKLFRRLRRIDVPTLVLWGEADGLASLEYGRAFAAAIPRAHFRTLARAGRYPYLEQPEAFTQAVLQFLAEER